MNIINYYFDQFKKIDELVEYFLEKFLVVGR